MISRYKLGTYVMRFFVYVLLFVLLIVTIVPIWLLIVNATRSTTEIQQGISLLPSTHMVENYDILIGRGLEHAERLCQQPVSRRRFDGGHGVLLAADRLRPGGLQLQRAEN